MKSAKVQLTRAGKLSFVRMSALCMLIVVATGAIYLVSTKEKSRPATHGGLNPLQPSALLTTVGHQNESAKARPAVSKLSLVSCAACHGTRSSRDNQDDQNNWKSAYQIWARRDPHSSAYVSLWNERSKQIVAALATIRSKNPAAVRSPISDQHAYQKILNERCVSCHSTASVVMPSLPGKEQNPLDAGLLLSGGVSCLSCHSNNNGDSIRQQAWVSAHTLEGWSTKNTVEKAAMGLQDLSLHSARVQTCLKCHLGAPGQEVNHDLIAAGHPRLVFEYSSHLARLPKHWQENTLPDFHKDCWSIGQIEAAMSSLKQLSRRSQAAVSRFDSSDGHLEVHPLSSWPEFSEYNCHNCHHDLQTSWYQKNNDAFFAQPAWGTWAFPRHLKFEALAADLATVREEMENPVPDAKNILLATKNLESLIASNIQQISRNGLIYSYLRKEPRLNWDELFSWYLAAACVARDMASAQEAKHDLAVVALIDLKVVLDRPFQANASRDSAQFTASEIYEKISRVRTLVLPDE